MKKVYYLLFFYLKNTLRNKVVNMVGFKVMILLINIYLYDDVDINYEYYFIFIYIIVYE